MNKTFKKALISFIIPVIVIIVAFTRSIWLGFAAILLYLAVLLYVKRVLLYTLMGSRNYSLGKTEQALKWLKRAHETKKSSARPSVSYAYILLKSGDSVKSEEILQKLLKDNSSNQDTPYIKSNLALVLWKKGELDAAVEMLEDLMKTYKTTTVYGSLGYLYILKGDLEKALQFNLEAKDYNSADKVILDNLGQNYYLLGNYDKAKEIYEPLIAQTPGFPEPYYNYALVLEKLGEPESALEMAKKALNYKFTYLSSINRDEVESKIQQLSGGIETA
ncbi:MAG: tetratricopeptide repeat protein [Clostridiaceae bacterium]